MIEAWEEFVKDSARSTLSKGLEEYEKEFWTMEQIKKSQVQHVLQRLTEEDWKILKIERELYDVVVSQSIKWVGVSPKDGGYLMPRYLRAQQVLLGKRPNLPLWQLDMTVGAMSDIRAELENSLRFWNYSSWDCEGQSNGNLSELMPMPYQCWASDTNYPDTTWIPTCQDPPDTYLTQFPKSRYLPDLTVRYLGSICIISALNIGEYIDQLYR
jgi:hypothetical protein